MAQVIRIATDKIQRSVVSPKSVGASKSMDALMSVGAVRSVGSTVSKMTSLLPQRRRDVDEEWEVGCSYVVQATYVQLWPTKGMSGAPVGVLKQLDEFTLMAFEGAHATIGLLLPRSSTGVLDLGWATLETHKEEAQPVVKSRIQKRSWSIGGRYRLMHEATIREDKSLRSRALAGLSKGDEVLVLEMGHNEQGEEIPRLRMKVASASGLIGWITPITTAGPALLESTNLLAPEMVDIRKSHRARQSNFLASVVMGRTTSYESSGGHTSWHPNDHYRVLQAADLMEEPSDHGNVVAQLAPGEIVEVVSVKEGLRPMASVAVLPDRRMRGWLFLRSKGFDVLDTRDLNEYEKVQAYLSGASVETQAGVAGEVEDKSDEDTRARQQQCMAGCLKT